MLRVRIFVGREPRWSRLISRAALKSTLAIIVRELSRAPNRYCVVADDGGVYSILWRQQ